MNFSRNLCLIRPILSYAGVLHSCIVGSFATRKFLESTKVTHFTFFLQNHGGGYNGFKGSNRSWGHDLNSRGRGFTQASNGNRGSFPALQKQKPSRLKH